MLTTGTEEITSPGVSDLHLAPLRSKDQCPRSVFENIWQFSIYDYLPLSGDLL